MRLSKKEKEEFKIYDKIVSTHQVTCFKCGSSDSIQSDEAWYAVDVFVENGWYATDKFIYCANCKPKKKN